jgi:hypothetical protein
MLLACGSAAAAVLLRDRRLRTAALLLALTLAPILVLGDVWDEPRVVGFRHNATQLGGGLAVAAIGIALLVIVFRVHPRAFPVSALAVLPLRVPVEIGGETANLLIPLYLVIAAGAITAAIWPRDDTASVRDGAGWPQWLRWALAATLVLYAVQAAYSEDVPNAIENIGFFLVPFSALFVLLAELRWDQALLRTGLIAIVAVATACAAVAIYQYFVRDLFFNPELFDANELHVYFRVNSIFYDPNILGRYLALALTVLGACIAWGGSRRDLVLGALAFALGLVGLAFSYSITGFAALFAGLGMVAILRWRWRGAVAIGAIGAAGLAALLIAGGTPTSDIESDRSIDSGHYDLVRGGLQLAGVIDEGSDTVGGSQGEQFGRPIAGHGSGSFGAAFYNDIEHARTTVSHSEPITVAAEQGGIGLIVYVALLVTALVTLLGAGAGASMARAAVGAGFVAMVISSFGYTGFATDPATWALLALGLALRRDPPELSTTIPT